MPSANDFLADVLAYIDRHLFEPVTLADMAAAAGYSPYHFTRLFAAHFGETPMEYLRACRMQRAAQRLGAIDPPPLIDLALDCGFESQEAFTRAFRKRFGVPPGQYRQSRSQDMEVSMNAQTNPQTANVVLLPERVRRGAFRIAGAAAEFDKTNKAGIPTLWPKLLGALPLPGQAPSGEAFGVVQMIDRDCGRMRYMAGVEVTGDPKLPEGFDIIDLQPQTYAVFRITLDGSALQPQIMAAMQEVWGKLIPQSGLKPVPAPDFELCPPGFEPMRKGQILDYHIPVEP